MSGWKRSVSVFVLVVAAFSDPQEAASHLTHLFGKWDDVKIMCRCRQFLLVLVSRHRSEEEACESKT